MISILVKFEMSELYVKSLVAMREDVVHLI